MMRRTTLGSLNRGSLVKQILINKRFSTNLSDQIKKKTILDIHSKYIEKKKLSMVTAYDFTSGTLADKADVDMILVGDSYKMVMCGEEGTSSATIDEMIYHCRAVTKGAKRSFIVGDMTFGSYEITTEDAVRNATRLVKEGGVHAIKLEGGRRIKDRIEGIVRAGIPVMGHIGLTPQTSNALGGYKVQGKTAEAAAELVEDAKALQEAGCFAIVIECVPEKIVDYITSILKIPTIGIGAGNKSSGQVLVWHDMFGLYQEFAPKFSKQYTNAGQQILDGLKKYKEEVENQIFPEPKHTFKLKDEEWHKFCTMNNIPIQEKVQVPYENSKPAVVKNQNIFPLPNLVKQLLPPKPTTVPFGNYKVAIIGGGSMGSLVAARLSSNNFLNPTKPCDVWLLSSWSQHVDMINSKGLALHEVSDKGTEFNTIANVNATSNVEDIIKDGQTPDLIIVLVKSPYTSKAAEKVKQLVTNANKSVTVLTLQNGMGNLETLQNFIGQDPNVKVVQGVTDCGALVIGAGHVQATGKGTTTIAGLSKDPKGEFIRNLFNNSGLETNLNDDLESVTWGKLIVNAVINPITAVLNLDNGALVTNPTARKMLLQALNEAVTVANKRGINLPYNNPLEKIESVARNTANNRSSMLQDFLRGEQTEIESINGVIVREGEKLGVDVKFNKHLLSLFTHWIGDEGKVDLK